MAEEEAGGGAAAPPLEEEDRPKWLPEGWTMITKTRNNGRVDRYYRSLLTGQTLRSKAKVILYANRHMSPDGELQAQSRLCLDEKLQAQSRLCLDEKRYPESNKFQAIEEAHFSLPDGWIVETKFRRGGKNPGGSYKTYFNPVTGFKCYSMKDVFRYVTGREPRRGVKKRAALSSPDSVLMQIEGPSKRQPFGLENASRHKENKTHIAASTQHWSTVRRSLFGSQMLSFNGIAELSLEDPFFQNYNMDSNQCVDASEPFPVRSMDVYNTGGVNMWAGKVNTIFEGQPYHQNIFPEHYQEEAGQICNSIDELIRNLPHDFKIPDINVTYATCIEQGMFNQAGNIGADVNTRPTVKQPTEQSAVGYSEKSEEVKVSERLSDSSHSRKADSFEIKPDYLPLREPWETTKVGFAFEDTKDVSKDTPCELKTTIKTSSTDQLPQKPHEQMDHSVATNKNDELKGKSCGGAVEIVNEPSVDMVPEEMGELSKAGLPVPACDKSATRSSRQGCEAVDGKQSEPANEEPSSPRGNKESEAMEQNASKSKKTKEDHPVASSGAPSTRDRKGRYKMAAITLPPRTSRRLAGLDAGPNAYVDINEHALRRKKRMAGDKENKVKPNKDSSLKAAEEECIVYQCPDYISTLKAPISTPPSDAKDKPLPEQDPIIVDEDPMTADEPVPPSTGEDLIFTAGQSVPLCTGEDPITTEQPVPLCAGEDPITTEQPVPLSTEPGGENPKPASTKTSLFGEAFLDPCLQFAVKTLTGDLPIFDGPAATGGGLFHQQTCPVYNSGSMGRREGNQPSAYHAVPNGYFHHSNINGFSQPNTPFPNDRVLNLNFATGTITRLSPFKYVFHSDSQAQRKSGSKGTG